ncbi:hypothetical protein B9Z65_8825 [Elsinoe australis]|uniref:Mannosyltransferase n=1 Tax=Elsinoe australis TaxID=40998 RepID=A0A2P7YEV5_9PEZI|nr:hypothetical protein B9Z65_8825 [Elsinoe australis]
MRPPTNATNTLLFLLAIRILNAFTVETFFQPDEYFQSLEPAWQIAFGKQSGAWITWEWREHLRSSIHPYIFAACYKGAAQLTSILQLDSHTKGELFITAPKVLQAVFAALMDFYTWKLSVKHHGLRSQASLVTLFICIFSPWQWFCSTRTLMNSLECTLTAAALYYWPWETFTGVASIKRVPYRGSLVLSFILAATASILRAPNIIIWAVIGGCSVMYRLWLWQRALPVLSQVLLLATLCGSQVLLWCALADYQYYGRPVLPPLRFIHFNVVQSLAVFYGSNRKDYYSTEGLPILLTTFLPFALHGMYTSLGNTFPLRGHCKLSLPARTAAVRDTTLILVTLTTIVILSTIPHKEVRFLYPLLPILHTFVAPSLTTFFAPFPSPRLTYRKIVLFLLLTFNVLLALYASLVHQRGVIAVTHYLRHAHEARQAAFASNPHAPASGTDDIRGGNNDEAITTVAFLMPCHSTPWRSHLVHAGIKAWALTCEPPLNKTLAERATYLDEADEFYVRPTRWMGEKMAGTSTIAGTKGIGNGKGVWTRGNKEDEEGKRKWPLYLVFFEQLEPVMRTYLAQTAYEECWRGFNSHFHDDWRRKGDVVVWCMEGVGR